MGIHHAGRFYERNFPPGQHLLGNIRISSAVRHVLTEEFPLKPITVFPLSLRFTVRRGWTRAGRTVLQVLLPDLASGTSRYNTRLDQVDVTAGNPCLSSVLEKTGNTERASDQIRDGLTPGR